MKNNALTYRQFGEPDAVLTLHSAEKGPLAADALRVQMLLAPVNASDLIPVTGAYRHRITLPAVAG
jgi:NADPH:quinone reductase-like Zn-dependent oxidoreductase